MTPEQKRQAIAEANQWYAANKSLSADDRMLAFFDSQATRRMRKTAAEILAQKEDKRAVAPILKKIPEAGQCNTDKLL